MALKGKPFHYLFPQINTPHIANADALLSIGRMISEGYVRAGAKVYISSRDAKSCEEACKELNAMGPGSATAIPADFYKEEDCKRLAEELGRVEKIEGGGEEREKKVAWLAYYRHGFGLGEHYNSLRKS